VLIERGTHRLSQALLAARCVTDALCDRAKLLQHLSL